MKTDPWTLYTGISSILIALCALGASLYGLYATRRHYRLSVTPHIVGCRNTQRNTDGLVLGYDLANHGLGPAKLKSFTLFLDGKEFPRSEKGNPVEHLVDAKIQGRVKYLVRASGCPNKDYCITSGQVYRVVEVFFPDVHRDQEAEIDQIITGMDLQVRYESMYGVAHTFDTRERSN